MYLTASGPQHIRDLLTAMVCILVLHLKFYKNECHLLNIIARFQKPMLRKYGKIPYFRVKMP